MIPLCGLMKAYLGNEDSKSKREEEATVLRIERANILALIPCPAIQIMLDICNLDLTMEKSRLCGEQVR